MMAMTTRFALSSSEGADEAWSLVQEADRPDDAAGCRGLALACALPSRAHRL